MILYNVTINIDRDVENEWLEWMKMTHVPDVMKTGMFSGNKIFRLLNEDPQSGGSTYSIQYFTSDLGKVNQYLEDHAPPLIEEHQLKYKDKFVAFRTVLELVE